MIRTYQIEQGGPAFESKSLRGRSVGRNRVTALAVIAAVAASAGLLQHFNNNLAPSGPAAPDAGIYFAAR
ncbi:hypothetical protein [Caulobacter sp.]|uniref:hypothetical protein n=1 Tax=Caulobacter sp. TaxID=78 RepID=UPI003BAE499F